MQRVTDEQIRAEFACRYDDDCSRCPFVEAHLKPHDDCHHLRCNELDAYKDLQDARAQLAIAVKALEAIREKGKASSAFDEHFLRLQAARAIANDALKEIQE